MFFSSQTTPVTGQWFCLELWAQLQSLSRLTGNVCRLRGKGHGRSATDSSPAQGFSASQASRELLKTTRAWGPRTGSEFINLSPDSRSTIFTGSVNDSEEKSERRASRQRASQNTEGSWCREPPPGVGSQALQPEKKEGGVCASQWLVYFTCRSGAPVWDFWAQVTLSFQCDQSLSGDGDNHKIINTSHNPSLFPAPRDIHI